MLRANHLLTMSKYKKGNLILELTFAFSVDVMTYCSLLESQRLFLMSRQLWRSGTSIGALVHEAQNAESKLDFIHKMKIAGKEAEETIYWIRLCRASVNYPNAEHLESQALSIAKILNIIISSTKKSL